jgi:titin
LVATPGDTELLITFDMPSANGSDITRFEYSIDEGDAISTGRDEPAFTVTGLTNGTEYSIRVRAVNGVGRSGWSNPVTGTPEAGTAPPDAPTDLSAAVLAGDIVISFTPGSDNGAEITDYEAYVDGRDWISTGATDSPAVLKDLPSGNTYEISLRGVNAEGKGSISESILVTLPLDTDGDGVPDSMDACPTDPTCSALPIPALPWPVLLALLGFMGWYGRRLLAAQT